MKKILVGLALAVCVGFVPAAKADMAYAATGVTTGTGVGPFQARYYHEAQLCVTVASGALTTIQMQTVDANGNVYNLGTALTTTGCTFVSSYSGVGLGQRIKLAWTAGTANFSYSLYLKE